MPVNKLMSRLKPPPAPTTKTCPECLSEIPIAAKRCAHCTSPLAA
jgi:large conductance mechanosensitive channel